MLTAAQRYLLNRLNNGARSLLLGNLLSNQLNAAKGLYDFSIHGGAVSTINLDDVTNEFGTTSNVVIPSGSIIWSGVVDTLTQGATSASGTFSLGLNTTTDLLGATAAASINNRVALVPVGTAASCVKLTADRTLTTSIATGAVTAGKFNVYLQYWQG